MSTPQISQDELMKLDTFADAIDLLNEMQVFSDSDAQPFPLMAAEYKERLVGTPFIILEAVKKPGINDTDYYEIKLVTYADEKVTIRDSSRGIYHQLDGMIKARSRAHRHHPNCGFYIRKGLRFTTNPYTDPATMLTTETKTYYLDI